ncbi:very short patch repair endonuclease [Pseudomonas mosselii]|nr:very short patch repair endonuclease [Pseudomonas mosselii]
MSLVKGKNTAPEMLVRRLVHGAGFRYRLHDTKLPGKPDMVFPRKHKVIFINGCFWHRHEGCALTRTPKSNQEFWFAKFESNKTRDKVNLQKLYDEGWSVLVIWECELRDLAVVAHRLRSFLSDAPRLDRANIPSK